MAPDVADRAAGAHHRRASRAGGRELTGGAAGRLRDTLAPKRRSEFTELDCAARHGRVRRLPSRGG